MQPLIFNKVVKTDDKTFLKDEAAICRRLNQANELQSILDDAAKFLRECDFPCREEDIYNVLDDGRYGLMAVVWSRADREAKRLGVRDYVAQTWREQEREAVTPDQWDQADALYSRHQRAIDGLALNRTTDITEKDGRLVVNIETISRRVEDACTIGITPQMEKDLADVLDLADKVKAMELRGINALELLDKFVRASERPDEAELYRLITFRRHQVGTIHDAGIDYLINQAAINRLNDSLNK